MQIASLHVSIPSAGSRLALRSTEPVAPVPTIAQGDASAEQPQPEIDIAGPDQDVEAAGEHTHRHGHGGSAEEFDSVEQDELKRLRAIDAQVRAHERAHQAAGGNLAGAARFTYVTGPDGRRYASSGEVSINTSEGATPQQTLARARRVRAAALAPADPSAADLAVAAAAAQMEMRARAELQAAAREEAVATHGGGAPIDAGLGIDAVEEVELFGGRTALGEDGHLHLSGGCSFCNSAVAAFNVNA